MKVSARTNRRDFLRLSGGLAAWFTATGTAAVRRPNVILCMADDLGWGDTGFNGNTTIRTPNLDDMARSGLRFTRFYAASPVCSPTRGSSLTGRHPFRYGITFANEGHMKKEEVTLAEALKPLGYTSGHFGKWHLGTLSKTDPARPGRKDPLEHYSTPADNGFDEWFSTEYAVRTWDPGETTVRTENAQGKQSTFQASRYYHNGRAVTENLQGDDSRVIMDRAIPFIERAARSTTPFLAVIWFHAPHAPVMAGPEYQAMYKEHSEGEQHYYGCITALDEQMGRLRRTLKQLGVASNTMLWFASDNGPEGMTATEGRNRGSAGPFRGRKRSLFEGGVRVPALLEWPGVTKAGSTTDVACCTLDYFPTVMAVTGAVVPAQPKPLDGIDLSRIVQGRIKQRKQWLAFQTSTDGGAAGRHGSPRLAIMDDRYKLLSDLEENSPDLLFDLQADPGEKNNLASAEAGRVTKMKHTLLKWRESCQASASGHDYNGT